MLIKILVAIAAIAVVFAVIVALQPSSFRPDDLIRIRLEFFKPFAATNLSEFIFKPEGDQTMVTWTMTGNNNFMAKAVHLFMNMDTMVGGQFEKGLAQMKTAAEATAKP
jgi:hypothetical protein